MRSRTRWPWPWPTTARRGGPEPSAELLAAKQLAQAGLVDHRHAQPLGVRELRPTAIAGHEVGSPLRDRARDLAACGRDHLGRLLAGQLRQRPGEHERRSGERSLARRGTLLLERQAAISEV